MIYAVLSYTVIYFNEYIFGHLIETENIIAFIIVKSQITVNEQNRNF